MSLFDRLPEITWHQDASWRREFARAADDLASDLERGEWPEPTNAMEEMALHLAIEDAPGWVVEAGEDDDHEHMQIPAHADDYDWGLCSELLFQDHDILMLFDKKMSGIEDPGALANVLGGVGDLRPANWTMPFDNVTLRAPDRGFRR